MSNTVYYVVMNARSLNPILGTRHFRLSKSAVSLAQAIHFAKEFINQIRRVSAKSSNNIRIIDGTITDFDDTTEYKYSIQSDRWYCTKHS